MSSLPLSVVHARYQLLEQFRTPVSVVLGLAGPTLMYLFFLLPQVRLNPSSQAALSATIAMCVFGAMSNALFGFSLEIASARETAWADFLRSLPGSARARIMGYVLSTGVMGVLSMVPVVVVAVLFTSIKVPVVNWPALVLTLLITSLPFMFLSALIGYLFSLRSAIAVVQLCMIVFAVLGGLFIPPAAFPGWFDLISQATPARAAFDLSLAATGAGTMPWVALTCWFAWTVVGGGLAVAASRRDRSGGASTVSGT